MRILLVSDIHANWPALGAIADPFDVALFLGDLVEYGVEPGPCTAWVRERCGFGVRGNHDHGAIQNVAPSAGVVRGFKHLTGVTRPLGRRLLGDDDARFIAQLPLTKYATLDGRRFLMVHATPRDPLDEYGPADPDFWAKRLLGIDADIVCVGHTHQPYALEVGDKLVINPGSVGLQREGDPRVSYCILDGAKVTLRRIDYPIEDTVRAVENSELAEADKQMLVHVYRHGKLPDTPNGNGTHKVKESRTAAQTA